MHKLLVPLLLCLPLTLVACDTSADNKASQTGGEPSQNAAATAPPPKGPANGYEEHEIFNDRYSSTTEIVYVSPVDGKTMICMVYRTGNGAGNSCRVKG